MNALKISVVIPAFNREKTIRRCLESVLRQTMSPDEVIIVDDCSTDSTVNIIRENTDPRVRCVILDTKSGAQTARNYGIRIAQGDWIAFQDSDDEWLPHKLEKQVKALESTSYDPWTVVHTSAIWYDSVANRQLSFELPIVEGDDVYQNLLRKPGPFLQSMLVSRKALEKINYLDEKVPSYQEWDTSIRLAKHCRFIHINEPLFIYHIHEDETISKDKKRDIAGYQYVIDKFKDEIINICGKQAWEDHLFKQLAKCLNFRFWPESDAYFSQITVRRLKYRTFQLFRMFHLSPLSIQRMVTHEWRRE